MEFNPDFSFEQRQQAINNRKQRLAAAMKAMQEGAPMPQGQMVGTGPGARFVPPSWAEMLNPAVKQGIAGYQASREQQGLETAQGEYERAANQARDQWMQQRPQTVPGTAPDDAYGGGPPSPDVEPSEQDLIQWAMGGAKIPGLESLSGSLVTDQLVNAPKRKEAAAEKAEARREQIKAAMDTKDRDIAARAEAAQTQRNFQEQQDRMYRRTAAQVAGRSAPRDRFSVQTGADGQLYRVNLETGEAQPVTMPGGQGFTKPVVATESERSSAGFLGRMQAAEQQLGQIKDGEPTYTSAVAAKIPGIGEDVRKVWSTEAQNQQKILADDWIRAKLRKESGAVIGAQEMAEEYSTYFPKQGDSDRIKEIKRQARRQAEEQMRSSAGRVEPKIAPQGAPAGALSAAEQAELDKLRAKHRGGK